MPWPRSKVGAAEIWNLHVGTAERVQNPAPSSVGGCQVVLTNSCFRSRCAPADKADFSESLAFLSLTVLPLTWDNMVGALAPQQMLCFHCFSFAFFSFTFSLTSVAWLDCCFSKQHKRCVRLCVVLCCARAYCCRASHAQVDAFITAVKTESKISQIKCKVSWKVVIFVVRRIQI